MNQYQGDPNMQMQPGYGQVQGDPNMQMQPGYGQANAGSTALQSGFRQLILNSIVTKNKMDALGNIRGRGKDPETRGLEMQNVLQEFAGMTPAQLGNLTLVNAFGNAGRSIGNMGRSLRNARRSMFGFGGRSRKKRKTRRR
jgi:hypothetical protein